MSAPVSREERHTRSHRCPVCKGADQDPRGQHKRCTGFTNSHAGYVWCSREEHAGSLEPKDVQGVTMYAHRLGDACRCGTSHGGTSRSRREDPEAVYPYVDEAGDVLYEVLRMPGKRFLQRKPNGNGGHDWKLAGTRRVLYRLPALLASDSTAPVYIVEGEKDAGTLAEVGVLSTCNAQGAGKWGTVEAHAREVLAGRPVVVIADRDEPGKRHARQVAASLEGHAASVRLVLPPEPHKDITDAVRALGAAALEALAPLPPEGQDEPPSAVRSGGDVRAIRAVPPDSRPEIVLGVDLQRMTDDSIAALAADRWHVFQRAGALCTVVTIPSGPDQIVHGVRRSSGANVIRPMALPTVRERMASSARFLKFDGRKKEYVASLPPMPVVQSVCARGEWGGVRPLVSVATCPSLRPDGTVLQEGGYDPSTGILLWPSEDFPTVASAPSREDAVGALAALREVVCDFPFASPEHESAWLAGVLTMIARPAIDGPVPLFAVDATTAGTGKSRLVNVASRIAAGHDASVTAMPRDDEELRKRISAIVLEGDPCVCLDNIRGAIAMPSLEAVITSTTWKDRVLGSTATLSAPHRSVWWATGNNLAFSGDLTRRTIHIRLESPLERPEEREDFTHPHLLEWATSQRRRLVGAALTLLRAFCVAREREPSTLPRVAQWGSFEAWSRLIPSALVWLGMPDPMLARANQHEGLDEEKSSLAALLEGLSRACSAGPMSARAILDEVYRSRVNYSAYGGLIPGASAENYDDLKEAIETETRAKPGERPDARRFGKWLTRVRGRVISGRSLQRRQNTATNSALWVVAPVQT